jgi:hypothetical protein
MKDKVIKTNDSNKDKEDSEDNNNKEDEDINMDGE